MSGFCAYDLVFYALFCYFLLRPFPWKKIACLLIVFSVAAGAGALLAHGTCQRFVTSLPTDQYAVTGTAVSVVHNNGYCSAILSELTIDGVSVGGNLRASITGEGYSVGDILSFEGKLTRVTEEDIANGEAYLFTEDIRYCANVDGAERTGESPNPFLRLNGALYSLLHANMEGDCADLSYALLTGSGGSVDGSLMNVVRRGGIAHIFAVSGLHIGILFSAIFLLLKPLGRWRVLPAALVAFLYCGLCGFTTSSLRAAVMCTVGGTLRAFGEKQDFLESIAIAALCVLCIFPAELLAVGFRLSFGACLGLALFSGSFSRGLKAIRLPSFLAEYLSASLAVQLFTLPVLVESFGYLSLWGMLLNFFVIPALPFLFLALIVCAALSLLITPLAPASLALPAGAIQLLLFALSAVDLTAVASGFSLGAGAVVWLVACVALSERFRLGRLARGVTAGALAILFALCVIVENCVFVGCKIESCVRGEGNCVLVRTPTESVLVIDGEISLAECEEFLSHRYAGTLTAVVLLDEELSALNVAGFLPSERVYALEERETGFTNREVIFGESFSVGELCFRFESPARLTMTAENTVVEFAFDAFEGFESDLFVGSGRRNLIFYCVGGIIIGR